MALRAMCKYFTLLTIMHLPKLSSGDYFAEHANRKWMLENLNVCPQLLVRPWPLHQQQNQERVTSSSQQWPDLDLEEESHPLVREQASSLPQQQDLELKQGSLPSPHPQQQIQEQTLSPPPQQEWEQEPSHTIAPEQQSTAEKRPRTTNPNSSALPWDPFSPGPLSPPDASPKPTKSHKRKKLNPIFVPVTQRQTRGSKRGK